MDCWDVWPQAPTPFPFSLTSLNWLVVRYELEGDEAQCQQLASMDHLQELDLTVISPDLLTGFHHLTRLDLTTEYHRPWRPQFCRLQELYLNCGVDIDVTSPLWNFSAMKLDLVRLQIDDLRNGRNFDPNPFPQIEGIHAEHICVSLPGAHPHRKCSVHMHTWISTWRMQSCQLLVAGMPACAVQFAKAAKMVCKTGVTIEELAVA